MFRGESRFGARATCLLLAWVVIPIVSSAQMTISLSTSSNLSLCDTAVVTNRLVNSGVTLSGLLVTNLLPSAEYVYVPGASRISLPNGTVLTNAAADPAIGSGGTALSWDFSTATSTGGVNHLVLSEVFYWATNSLDFDVARLYQWFEIFNPTPGAIAISNWVVRDALPGQYDSLPPISLQPGEFVVVAADTNRFLQMYPGYSNQLFGIVDDATNGIGNGLNYYMDGLALCDEGSNIVDAVSYGLSTNFMNLPVYLVSTSGHSMARQPANEDSGTRNDWLDRAIPDPGQGVIRSGINAGDVIEIVFSLEMPCSASPGTLRCSTVFQQPPEAAPSTNSLSMLLNPQTPALVVRKSPVLQSRRYHDAFTWDVTVKNEGFGHAPNVVVRDAIGPGIQFLGFSVPPTNGVIGQSVTWDQTVFPALTNLAPGEQISITVTAQVIACSELYNDADASWGCSGLTVAPNGTCGDTAISEGTARATIDFITEKPRLSGQIAPAEPMAISYCTGSEISIVLTNPPDAGPARNIALLYTLPNGFALTGSAVAVSNAVWVGDLEPGSETNIVVTLKPSGSCPVPTGIQQLFFESSYEDLCGNGFSALSMATSFQVANEPGASIYKIIPGSISGNQPTTSVAIVFAYSNFDNTAITIVDTYPRDPSNLLGVANIDQAGVNDGTNITWSLNLSGSGVVTTHFDLVITAPAEDQCNAPDSLLANVLTAPAFSNCLGCIRDVSGSGQSYPVSFYPSRCGTGGCSYGSAKYVSPSLAEACSPVLITQDFTFSGAVPSNDWNGASFHSDLGRGTVDSNMVAVYADGSNVTPYVGFTQVSPQLVLDLVGLSNSVFDNPSKVTNSLTVVWAVANTNIGHIIDYSWLTLGACGGRGTWAGWNQGEGILAMSLSSLTNNSACGISTLNVALTNLLSPEAGGATPGHFPTYDVQVSVDLDEDNDGLFSYDYITNTTIFTGMKDLNDNPIAAGDPTIQDGVLTWELGGLASNGAGTISFNVRGSCASYANEKHAARAAYNTRCHVGETPRVRGAASVTNSLPPLFAGDLQNELQPQYTFLTSTQYVTRIDVFNAGAGVSYNVGVEMSLPSNILFGAAGAAPTLVTLTNVVWGSFPTNNPLGDLEDLDGDGFADDLRPNGTFAIWVTNHVSTCGENSLGSRASHGCKAAACQVTVEERAEFVTASGQLVTRLDFPVNLVVCSNSTAEYSVRNAGLVDLIDVHAKLVLPTGITYMADSSRYVFMDVTNVVVGNPSGAGTLGDPLIWNDTLIPPLATLQPTQTVTILFDFPIECASAFSDGRFHLLAEYTDICGRTNTSQTALVNASLRKPNLNIVMEASPNGLSFTGGQLVRDPNDPIVYRVQMEHTASSEAPVNAMELTVTLPTNVTFEGASPAPDSQTGPLGAVLTWNTATLTAGVGGAPYQVGAPEIIVLITSRVVGCATDLSTQSAVEYGCSDVDRCFSAAASHGLRTAPYFPQLSSRMNMALNSCTGPKSVSVTNLGATSVGLVLHEKAPQGYLYASAAITGAFYAADAKLTMTGTPVGSEAILDLTTTNSSGAVGLYNHDGDPATLELGFEEGYVVNYVLISDGNNLDCTANPLDRDFNDPDPPPPVLATSISTMKYSSVCGATNNISGSVQIYPDQVDPEIALQPDCATITNGQVVLFNLIVRNNAQRGNAENLHIRVRFGSAWTNLALIASNIVQSGTGVLVYEQQGDTNVLVDLPGVIMDPVNDEVTMTFRATARETAGTLTVLSEIVGDCHDSRIIAQCIFTNTLGEAPLANTMTGVVVQAVNGQYYGFDQDLSSVIGNSFSKTVRSVDELPSAGTTERTARIGENLYYRFEATFYGSVFSNIFMVESLPVQMAFGTPTNQVYGGAITNAVYDPDTGVFTIQPQIVDASTPSSVTIDLPVVVSNRLDNQDGVTITNDAGCLFEVLGFTNELPTAQAQVTLREPVLNLSKTGGVDGVQSGQTVYFTNLIVHTGASTTNAYNLVFSDELPSGLTFAGMDLGADGLDNNDNGAIDEAVESELIQDSRTILICFTNNPALISMALNETLEFVYPALVTNQLVGGTLINTSRVTWTSLPGVDTGGNARNGSGGINDYFSTSTYAIASAPIVAVSKTFVTSSQTNLLDGATNAFTIGQRMIYAVRVDVPQGVIEDLVATDFIPPGMDWVGGNTNAGVSYAGLGYYITVPPGGLKVATNAAEGLVITDSDPTPDHSLTTDGSGLDVAFAFPPMTNAADGDTNNDYFILNLENVILDEAINDGIQPGAYTNRNGAGAQDSFRTLSADGPMYRIVEPDIRVTKVLTPTLADAGDLLTISLVVSNRDAALGSAYNVNVSDYLDAQIYDNGSIGSVAIPAGWAVSNVAGAGGLTHYFYSLSDVQLAPGSTVTNIFSINVAQTVEPNKVYTNTMIALDGGLQQLPPGGIPSRGNGATNTASFQVSNLSLAKALFATSETNVPPDAVATNVQVGEVVTYALTLTLPESTMTNLTVVDTLPPGLGLVHGSARLNTNGFEGTIGTLTVTPAGSGVAAGGLVFTNTFLGDTVATAKSGTSSNSFVLLVDTVVLNTNINVGAPTAAVQTNKGFITYFGNPSVPATSGVVRTYVVEPQLAISKGISPTNVDAGDVVTVGLFVTNTGNATAYGLVVSDLLATAHFDIGTLANVTVPTGYVWEVLGNSVRILSDTNSPTGTNSLEAGESVAFSFQVALAQSLRPNALVTNRVFLTARSLAETNVYGMQRGYTRTNTVVIRGKNFSLAKDLFATSETNVPPDSLTTNVQVGEVITYRIAVTLPEGTATNLSVIDRVATNGLAYARASARVDTNGYMGNPGGFTESPAGAGLLAPMGQAMTFTFTNVVTDADGDTNNNTFHLLLDCLVLETNQNRGMGIPRTVQTNVATVTFNGNTLPPVTSGVVRTYVVEPQLAISKSMSPTNVDAGDIVTVGLFVTNTGNATAYGLVVSDLLATAHFDIGTLANVTVPTGYVWEVLGNSVRILSDTNSPAGTNSLEAGESVAFGFEIAVAQS
ncbi:MAG TPA: hypothetical protein DCZ95_07310, partial [Verrucomicrobia bacterium]|nr:hypothetical protein [Verrucomicrobiota bacterium]